MALFYLGLGFTIQRLIEENRQNHKKPHLTSLLFETQVQCIIRSQQSLYKGYLKMEKKKKCLYFCSDNNAIPQASTKKMATVHLSMKTLKISLIRTRLISKHRPYDCPIDLQLMKDPQWNQFIIQCHQSSRFLEKFQVDSFFVWKTDGSLCLVVNCSGLMLGQKSQSTHLYPSVNTLIKLGLNYLHYK